MKKLLTMALMALICTMSFAQTKVTGKVTATDGTPVPFASVVVKGTMNGVATLDNGTYVLEKVPANGKLVFSCIGFLDQEVDVAGRTKIDVILATDTETLDETIVVAYGTAKKESVTGAVATIKSDVIESRPISSVTNALEGSVTGVLMNTTYGEPGSDATIRIRGVGSVNGSNSPLYIIDGVPFGGNVSDLNPQDIESLTVLKDATSAALYGNRASNGVIMITTKRGKTDKMTVTASAQSGIYSRGIPDYDKVGAADWMQIHFDGLMHNQMSAAGMSKADAIKSVKSTFMSNIGNYNIFNVSEDQLFDDNGKFNANATINPLYTDLDWYDAVERNGYRQEYNISAQGASEKSNYYMSVGYLDEQGQINFSDFSRLTGRANINITPTKWFKTGLVVSASMQEKNGISTGTTTIVNPLYFAQIMAPIYPIYMHDPETGEFLLDANGNKQYDKGEAQARTQLSARHAIWENELNTKTTKRWTTNSTLFADVKFCKDLTLTVKGDLNLRASNYRAYTNSLIGDGHGDHGRSSRELEYYKNYTFQQLLNYNHEWNDHGLEILLGHENYSYNYEYEHLYKIEETFFGKPELDNFNTIKAADGYQSDYRLESYFSRMKYNYLGKYYLEASFRRDGSSRFHPDNRWGNFWSVGGTWILSKEEFIKNLTWIDNLKLRASFGQVGNDASAGYYSYMSLYTKDVYAGQAEAYKTQNEAPNLVWESENSLSVALESRLFDRLNFTAEYFNKTTKDLLFDVYQPLSAGGTSTSSAESTQTMNLGSVLNSGWEFSADYDIIKTKDLTWNVGLNATLIKNKIVTLPEQNRKDGIINGTKRYLEGHGIYDYWLYQYAGVDQMDGRALYKFDDEAYYITDDNTASGNIIYGQKENADGVASELMKEAEYRVINGQPYVLKTTYAKKDWSGSALPKVFGSFSTGLTWKNFNLSTIITYQFGSKVIDYTYQTYMTASGSPHAYHADLLKSWTEAPEGMTADSPDRISTTAFPIVDNAVSSYTNATSTRFQFSGNAIVIKNLALSYSLPKQWVNKVDLTKVKVSASVDNLATFTAMKGMNAQQSLGGTIDIGFNTARVVSFGLNVTL